VLRLASALWQTSSLLLLDRAEAIAVDPGVTQPEVETIRDRARSEGVQVVATHGDFDHVAGIASFPDAEAVMGPRAADRIASGAALRDMADPPALVFPGHGAPLDAARALEIVETDLDYLDALRLAVAGSIEAGADREAAVQAGLAVPTPRSLPVNPSESRRNAERQFEELVAC
jgi:glyoxylase-like metal-dependent hydrolase (beta-lactamase superfamily II)